MGSYGWKPIARRLRSFDRKDAQSTEGHNRSHGEGRALALCWLAAISSVILAMTLPNWATVHCAVILCGIALTIYFAPWLEDRDAATPLKYDQRESEATVNPLDRKTDCGRAA